MSKPEVADRVASVAMALDMYFSYERGLDPYIEELSKLAADVRAGQASKVPEGWKLVPVEPTDEMMREMTDPFMAINGDNRTAFESAYRAMIAAAPSKETGE